jgi:hypothetical protein
MHLRLSMTKPYRIQKVFLRGIYQNGITCKFRRFPEVRRFSFLIRQRVLAGTWHNAKIMDTANLDLAYLEIDPRTQSPSASVYVKAAGRSDYAGVKADRLIAAQCLTFIELDTEIRRLHAELDEIRAKARKKFYKAHAAAAGA